MFAWRLVILAAFALGLCGCERAQVVDPKVRALVGDARVVLLSASWCGFCRRARADFRAWGVRFSEYDIETSDVGRRAYARIGESGVPILLIGERQFHGYSPARVRHLLDAAGALPAAPATSPSSHSVSFRG
jgi:glutaredoxin